MDAHSALTQELQLLTVNGMKPLLTEEATDLMVEMTDGIIGIFGENPDCASTVVLQIVLERHISPSPNEEWSLNTLFDALATPTPIPSLKRCIIKRILSAMMKTVPWSGEYYNVIYSIERYDKILRRLLSSYLPPAPLLDVNAIPEGIKPASIVVTDEGKRFYNELIDSVSYKGDAVKAGIINAARWVTILASKLNREDHESYARFIQSNFMSENLTESIFLRTLNVIFAELWRNGTAPHEVSYSDVVRACKHNSFWTHLPSYLSKTVLDETDESQPEEIPFEELFVSQAPSPSPDRDPNGSPAASPSPEVEFRPNFDNAISPSRIEIQAMERRTKEELSLSLEELTLRRQLAEIGNVT